MTERQIWFVTRPERDPKFHREALLALSEATNSFTMEWTGNRELHKHFEMKLAEMNLKRNSISNDGSGGRTWAAMLKTFSYCYVDEEGYMRATKIGLQIIRGIKVYDNIRKQLLTLQIPNAYYLEPGFRPKFSSDFAVRPIRFLIKLCSRADLDYHITKEEITFFAMTAKKDADIEDAADNIKRFRTLSDTEQTEQKSVIADKFEHRSRLDNTARGFEEAHSDVAHTFMLMCDYTGMVEYIRGRALRMDPSSINNVLEELDELDIRYPFNKRYMISLIRMAENSGLDVDSFKASSNRGTATAANRKKTEHKIRRLLKDYPFPEHMPVNQLEDILKKELPPREASEAAYYIKDQAGFSSLNSDFVEAYLNESDSTAFENKTAEILKVIGFDVEMSPRISGVGEHIEIMVKFGEDQCGIIDCKNYRQKFRLSSLLAALMYSDYIPNYDGYEGRRLDFFGYITASAFSGEKNLEKISRRTALYIPDRDMVGIMLNASALLGFLDACIERGVPQEERVQLFLRAINNCAYDSAEKLIRASGLRGS